jgi:MFS family permease
MTWSMPPAPPPPASETTQFAAVEAPRELRPVVVLLIANLTLSVILTLVTVLARHSIVNYQLDHRHITDPAVRATLRHSYVWTIIGRVIGNIVVSIVYAFLVRALLRGRRWAYRRVILLSVAGIAGLLLIQATPYPAWMRVEQLLQAAVLAGLLYCVTRPTVRAHFAKGLPGRDVRRFRRG